jgi:hypothetical protein
VWKNDASVSWISFATTIWAIRVGTIPSLRRGDPTLGRGCGIGCRYYGDCRQLPVGNTPVVSWAKPVFYCTTFSLITVLHPISGPFLFYYDPTRFFSLSTSPTLHLQLEPCSAAPTMLLAAAKLVASSCGISGRSARSLLPVLQCIDPWDFAPERTMKLPAVSRTFSALGFQ